MQRESDHLFRRWEAVVGDPAALPVNVWEDDEAFHVEADLPGVALEQVQVTVREGRELAREAERKEEGRAGTWHRRERVAGKVGRVLLLPAAVQADKVEARLEHGVLRVTLPKVEEA